MTMMRIALAKAHALPSTIDERRAKIRKASLATQKKSRDSFCSFSAPFAIIFYSAARWLETAHIRAGQEGAEPHMGRLAIDRPLATENQSEHEPDPERGKDRFRRVLADVLLAVVVKTADAMARIIPHPFRAAQILIGHYARGRAEIFRGFAGVRHTTLCFFSRLRRNRRTLIHLVFLSHRFPASYYCLNFRCRCFADSTDILSACSFENVLRPINVFAFIRVHGDQVIPLF